MITNALFLVVEIELRVAYFLDKTLALIHE